MKIDLINLLTRIPDVHRALEYSLLDDNGKPMPAANALHAMIMDYATAVLDGESEHLTVPHPELASQDLAITAAALLDAAAIALWKSTPATAISCITGHFVGMTVAYVECNGGCGAQEFFVDGGESRDITIHAAKPSSAQKIISE